MRFNFIIALLALLLSVGVDFYIYNCFKRSRYIYVKVWRNLLCFVAIIQYIALIVAIILPKSRGSNDTLIIVTWCIFVFLSIFLSKLIFSLISLIGKVPEIFKKKQWSVTSTVGLSVALLVFGAMWWGALINRYRISIVEVPLTFSTLPEGFDNYRIVQISDLHVSSFGTDTTFLHRVVSEINSLKPDLIVFTGDIVSRNSTELEPMIPTLCKLYAPDGVYAVLGNHDYGDYMQWPNDSSHMADRENLRRLYSLTPIKLLNNETIYLHRENDSIALIGVENIAEPPFITYGDLDVSYPNLADSTFKILLSHNPRHWVSDIKNNRKNNIALTLSGHTHAMQIQIAYMSPAALIYPTDWGLFTDEMGRYLYVNRGIGTVGFPMRLGATPEITLFTLSAK